MAKIQISLMMTVADKSESESIKAIIEAALSENGWKTEEDSAIYTYFETL